MIPRTQPTERRPERRAGPPAPAQPPRVSFEFFPPKTPALESSLWAAIERLAPLDPAFVSVTYGAGGGTRSRTHRIVGRLIGETALVPAAHLTCVGASRAEVDDVARAYNFAKSLRSRMTIDVAPADEPAHVYRAGGGES